MTENISTGTEIVKAETDPGTALALSDKEFADRLEAIAQDIETFERTRRKMILRIAKLVSEAHDLFLYRRDEGGFTGWMKARFNCSSSSAYRLRDVHKRFGDGESFPNWETLSDSALYLLAPPSVPKEALDVVAQRVEAGEKVSCAMVTDVIAKAKGNTTKSAADAEIREVGVADEDPSIEQRRAEHAALFGDGDSAAPESADPAVESGCSDAELLLEVWNESTPKDRQFIRDLVLEEFFAQASGADIYDRIPAASFDEVCSAFLDKLTVDGMRTRMSAEFGRQLRARLPAPKRKSDKPFKHTLNLKADSAHHRRGNHSRH